MQENSQENIKVSVLCKAYNQEKYIRQALEGFVKQKTNFRYEVLIHDDASTDRTADIIREYAEKFPDIIKPIFQKENQYSKDRKIEFRFLFPRVKGKYVAYCEGDDYWTDEYKLQKQFDVMEQNPNCTICTHKVQCINEDGTLNRRIIPSRKCGFHGGLQDKKKVAENIFLTYPFHTSSHFIRFDCISEYGNYDYANYFNIDGSSLRTALNFGDFWYIDEEMSRYRLLSIGSITSGHHSAPYELRRNLHVNTIKGNILYDEMSGKKFHPYISRCISENVFSIVKGDMMEYHLPFKKAYYDLLNEFGLSERSVFLSLDLRDKVRYILLRLAPTLYIRIRSKRNKK